MKDVPPFFQVKKAEEYARIKGKIMLDREHNLVDLDGKALKSKYDVYNAFSSALHFPRYFGVDWAAFSECLTDLSWLENKNTVVLLRNPADIEDALFESLADALEEACSLLAEQDVVLAAYLFAGDGKLSDSL